MSTSLRIFALVLITIYFVVIIRLLKKKKFALKYSLLWFLAGLLMLIVVIWPNVLVWGANLLGIEVASNGLFAMCILYIILMFAAPMITNASLLDIEWSLETFMPTFDVKFFTSLSILVLAVGGCEKVSPYVNKEGDKSITLLSV